MDCHPGKTYQTQKDGEDVGKGATDPKRRIHLADLEASFGESHRPTGACGRGLVPKKNDEARGERLESRKVREMLSYH